MHWKSAADATDSGTLRCQPLGTELQTQWTPEGTVDRQPVRAIGYLALFAIVALGCTQEGPMESAPADDVSVLPAPTTLPVVTIAPTSAATSEATAGPVSTTVAPAVAEPLPEPLLPSPDFEAFQESFDRSHPFQPLERFCLSVEPREDQPHATDRGITDQMVTIVQIRTRLDELARIGMSIPPDESASILEVFANLVNDECGGIFGRRIDLRIVEAPSLGGAGVDLDTLQAAACIEATESMPAVLVVDMAGLGSSAVRCVAVDHDVGVVSTGAHPLDLIADADGDLLTLSPATEVLLAATVKSAEERGLLAGRSIAVVVGDSAGQPDSIESGLIKPLRWLGYEPVLHLVGCEGSATCRLGRDTAVSRMIAAGADVVFPLLNLPSLPGLIGEMVRQEMPRPTIIQAGLNGQSGDVAARNVASFAGPAAGAFYDGALIVASQPTGASRLSGSEIPAFDAMCNTEYARASGRPTGTTFSPSSDIYRTVVEACSVIRIVARSVYDAGPDPRRRDVIHALEHLGPVDLPGMHPATSGHRKHALPDGVLDLEYGYPCGLDTVDPGETDLGCIMPVGGYRRLG
ncbi:MAG: hypothetical protein HN697_07370 [Actinobacteria bacterium]|nr:hypothetical protein [Actinomycetota bacterium]